ncbi:hypothetical protein RI367_000105 [Sorochytrium milnesiophthora]
MDTDVRSDDNFSDHDAAVTYNASAACSDDDVHGDSNSQSGVATSGVAHGGGSDSGAGERPVFVRSPSPSPSPRIPTRRAPMNPLANNNYPVLVNVPQHGWTMHVAPSGHLYWFNHATKQSTYDEPTSTDADPSPPFVQPPPPQIKYAITKPKPKEVPVRKYQLPDTPLFVVYTSFGNDYVYDASQKQSMWDAPEQFQALVDEFRLLMTGLGVMSGHKRKESQDSESKAEDSVDQPPNKKPREEEGEEAHDEAMEDEFAWQLAQMEQEEGEQEQVAVDPVIEFKAMLAEHNVTPFDAWEALVSKLEGDPRFGALAGDKDRKSAFDEYCAAKATEVRSTKSERTPREVFLELCAEHTTAKTRWDDFRRKHKRDSRFYSFGKNDKARESLFLEYISVLKDADKREASEAKEAFLSLLRGSDLSRSSVWRKVKRDLESDPRYTRVASSETRERYFNEFVRDLKPTALEEKEQARKKREEEALRERERQARQERAQVNRDISRGRMHLQHEEAANAFRSMLVDYVRQHSMTTREVYDVLERDPRYDAIRRDLPGRERDALLDEHMQTLFKSQLSAFHAMLEEAVPQLTPKTVLWANVEPTIKHDPRYLRMGRSSAKLSFLFDEWVARKTATARQEFEAYLRSNKFLDYWASNAAASAAGDGPTERALTYDEIEDVLRNDARWERLDHVADERRVMVHDFLGMLQAEKANEKARGFKTTRLERVIDRVYDLIEGAPGAQDNAVTLPHSMYFGPHLLSRNGNAPLIQDFIAGAATAQLTGGLLSMWEGQQPQRAVAPTEFQTNFSPLRCLVNVKRASVRVPHHTPSDTGTVNNLIGLEFDVDSSVACCIRVYWVASDCADLTAPQPDNIRLKRPAQTPPATEFRLPKGLDQRFVLPASHQLPLGSFTAQELTMLDLDELPRLNSAAGSPTAAASPSPPASPATPSPTAGTDNNHALWYPLIIVAEAAPQAPADEVPANAITNQYTYATLVPTSDGQYSIKVLKQKITIGAKSYVLQDIYGFAEDRGAGQAASNDADSGNNANSRECIVCMSDAKDTIVLPCRHLCLCRECADQLRKNSQKCPICRQDFHSLLHIKLPISGANRQMSRAPSAVGVKLDAVSEKSLRSRASSAILRTSAAVDSEFDDNVPLAVVGQQQQRTAAMHPAIVEGLVLQPSAPTRIEAELPAETTPEQQSSQSE